MKIKKRTWIILLCAAAALGGIFFAVHAKKSGGKDGTDSTAYVEKVSVLTGDDSGAVNKFSGVVQSQDTWSVSLDSDSEVKEVKVKVGDEVKKGDVLFTYDLETYENSLTQAQIEMERLQNELSSIQETIRQLEKQQKNSSSSEKASYTIQLQDENLSLKQKELDIKSKQIDIDGLKNKMNNASVKSEIDGVVQKISSSGSSADGGTVSADSYGMGSDGSSAFITIMQTGDLRVRGTINEQNIGQISEGSAVIVHSRRDDSTWKGTVSKIDTGSADNSTGTETVVSDGTDTGQTTSSYPFYVELEGSDGLMMGQHVYIEPDYGQADRREGIWLSEYYIDLSDMEHPSVWADDGEGKLVKKEVALGAHDEETMGYEIKSGITEDDSIAVPDDSLKEGMQTSLMEDMPPDGGEVMTDSGTASKDGAMSESDLRGEGTGDSGEAGVG